jgi:hypothetical protein
MEKSFAIFEISMLITKENRGHKFDLFSAGGEDLAVPTI